MTLDDRAGFYGDGTSGHSGSATSRRRAEREDRSGITGWRARQVYTMATQHGRAGITDADVQFALGIGHGASSGALTRLHRAGLVSRLTLERNGMQVYVLPEYVEGREESPYRPRTRASQEALATDQAKQVERALGEIEELRGRLESVRRFCDLRRERADSFQILLDVVDGKLSVGPTGLIERRPS